MNTTPYAPRVPIREYLARRGIRVDHPTVRRTLTESWQLRPAPPTYYQRYTITYNGLTQRQESKTARIYTVTRKLLDELLNDVSGL